MQRIYLASIYSDYVYSRCGLWHCFAKESLSTSIKSLVRRTAMLTAFHNRDLLWICGCWLTEKGRLQFSFGFHMFYFQRMMYLRVKTKQQRSWIFQKLESPPSSPVLRACTSYYAQTKTTCCKGLSCFFLPPLANVSFPSRIFFSIPVRDCLDAF